jgi:hypothetical protein
MALTGSFYLRFIMLSLHNGDYKASYAFVKWHEFDELYGCEGASSPSEMNSYRLVCSQQKVIKYDYYLHHICLCACKALKTTNWIFLKFHTEYSPKIY